MDYFEDVWYHGNIRKENPFLMFLAAPTEEKIDKISEGDKLMKELSNKVKKLNENPEVLDVIIENEDEIIANSLYEKGVEKGNFQKTKEIAKKLLDKNIDIDIISETTGLSIQELEKF